MHFRNIEIMEVEKNQKGDLFARLMGDLFHALGYDDEPRFNIHQSGREVDVTINHRTEKKIAIAECKAHEETIGGSDINKFVGVLDAEKKKFKKSRLYKNCEVVGYFISLSGFKETAVEQERSLDDERIILLKPEKIIKELIAGKIVVPAEQAIASTSKLSNNLTVADYADLFAYSKGWVWVIYFSNGQMITHFAFIHAEGKPLIKELADELINIDKLLGGKLAGLQYIPPLDDRLSFQAKIDEAKKSYFNYIENECGEIQFEGLPTDKDAGSVKVKLEKIFVPLFLEQIREPAKGKKEPSKLVDKQREGIGSILKKKNRLSILAKPGGGKSTLIKRLAIAYAFPERRKRVSDELPEVPWFPIFIRCRELGDKVTASITDIINNIPNRAEINHCSNAFSVLVSDALQNGNALLLVDGLDEIADDKDRLVFVNQLRTFLATYPSTNIIITSREAGFRVVAGSLAAYSSQYILSKLNSLEIVDLTIRWHQAIIDDSLNTINEAKALAKLILKDNRIKVLAENPLLLTTLLFVKRWAGYLPTKKSVLYQEMIKLLLVTWNVEGHEQLDIDEAEPQLAFIAYWMTSQGKQTITVDELKTGLVLARQQMPDILGYTKISVPDFIKRVESRSSLLIMSGHVKTESGQITPIYEFLHLSFQEYLTSKAIVEKYIPKKDASKSILELLKPHTENETWKEIFPLVAVLSKRDTKELVEYLINESKKIAGEARNGATAKKRRLRRQMSPPELLGNCIANEIQITPDLLDSAMEWYAKNRFHVHDGGLTEIILNGKFGYSFREKIRRLFFAKYDDTYASDLGGILGEIALIDLRESDINILLATVETNILNDSLTKEDKCVAILALMETAYLIAMPQERGEKQSVNKNIEEIYPVLLSALRSNDQHYYFSSCWALAWLANAGLVGEKFKLEIVNAIIDGWLTFNHYNLCRVSAWVLNYLLSPSLDISVDMKKLPKPKDVIVSRYGNPMNEYDKIVAVCIGSHVDIIWDKVEIQNLFKEKAERSSQAEIILQYSKALGINLSINKESETA